MADTRVFIPFEHLAKLLEGTTLIRPPEGDQWNLPIVQSTDPKWQAVFAGPVHVYQAGVTVERDLLIEAAGDRITISDDNAVTEVREQQPNVTRAHYFQHHLNRLTDQYVKTMERLQAEGFAAGREYNAEYQKLAKLRDEALGEP